MAREPINLDGQVFNRLTVLEVTDQRNTRNQHLYRCKCECGREHLASKKDLECGVARQCRYCAFEHMRKDITGQRFGKLVALHRGDSPEGERYNKMWVCRCDCGNELEVHQAALLAENTQSCGCTREESLHRLYIDGTNPSLIKSSVNKLRNNNASGVTGVHFDRARNRWMAYITFQNKRIHLGRFPSFEEAKKARKRAEEKYFIPVIEDWEKERQEDLLP